MKSRETFETGYEKFHSYDVALGIRAASLIGCFLVTNYCTQISTSPRRHTHVCRVTFSPGRELLGTTYN